MSRHSERDEASQITTDRETIRTWAEAHDVRPFQHEAEDQYRISSEDEVDQSHEPTAWDEFFDQVEAGEYVVIYYGEVTYNSIEVTDREDAFERSNVARDELAERLAAGETVTTSITETPETAERATEPRADDETRATEETSGTDEPTTESEPVGATRSGTETTDAETRASERDPEVGTTVSEVAMDAEPAADVRGEAISLSDDELGKDVVDATGKIIGMVTDVSEDGTTMYVDPDPGVTERIKAALDWGDADEDDYPVALDQIDQVSREAVWLEDAENLDETKPTA